MTVAPYLRYVAMCEGNLPQTKQVPEICLITKDLRRSGNLEFANTASILTHPILMSIVFEHYKQFEKLRRSVVK